MLEIYTIDSPIKPSIFYTLIPKDAVKEVALQALQELAWGLTFAAIACCFTATPAAGVLFLTMSVVGAIAGGILRLVAIGLQTTLPYLEKESHLFKVSLFATEILKPITPLTFGVVDLTTRQTLIHEYGHALAANTLFENAKPHITLNPLSGGSTHFWASKLTKWGAYWGWQNSHLIVAGAGAAAALAASLLGLGAAHYFKEKKPELSRYLTVTAIIGVASHVFYAAGAFFQKANLSSSHDFAALAAGGVHPALCIAVMIALPLLVKAALFSYDRLTAPTTSLAAKAA